MIVASVAERRAITREIILASPDHSVRKICHDNPTLNRAIVISVRNEMVARREIPDYKRLLSVKGSYQLARMPKGNKSGTGLFNKTRSIRKMLDTLTEYVYMGESNESRAAFHDAVHALVERANSLRWDRINRGNL